MELRKYAKNMNRDWFHLNNLEILTIVAFAPRPGTDFLHSLLDSHPEIISFDGWLHFHEFFDKAILTYGTKNLFFLVFERPLISLQPCILHAASEGRWKRRRNKKRPRIWKFSGLNAQKCNKKK